MKKFLTVLLIVCFFQLSVSFVLAQFINDPFGEITPTNSIDPSITPTAQPTEIVSPTISQNVSPTPSQVPSPTPTVTNDPAPTQVAIQSPVTPTPSNNSALSLNNGITPTATPPFPSPALSIHQVLPASLPKLLHAPLAIALSWFPKKLYSDQGFSTQTTKLFLGIGMFSILAGLLLFFFPLHRVKEKFSFFSRLKVLGNYPRRTLIKM